MQAELHGKISARGSNLHERLEDNLTGNFFGTLRYLPFSRGLGRMLAACVYPKEARQAIAGVQLEEWHEQMLFWDKCPECEIDALVKLPGLLLGIEVKYLSGLSGDDGVANGDMAERRDGQEWRQSEHQLARESRMLARRKGTGGAMLLFVAREADAWQIYKDTLERKILEPGVTLCVATWQDLLYSLDEVACETPYETLMLEDLRCLLRRKGFEQFRRFDPCDATPLDKNGYYSFGTGFGFTENCPAIQQEEYYVFG